MGTNPACITGLASTIGDFTDYDTQHNDIQHTNTQNEGLFETLRVTAFGITTLSIKDTGIQYSNSLY
jgi:hypothetical protein